MAELNFAHRELTARVVYLGPAGAGCATNIERLGALLGVPEVSAQPVANPAGETSAILALAAPGPEGLLPPRVRVTLEAWALPARVSAPQLRQAVLAEADAVVFVADAREDRARANAESLLELERMLLAAGHELGRFPACIQVNHLDGEAVREPSRVTFDLNPFGLPVIPANARSGEGVVETWSAVTAAMTARLGETLRGEGDRARVIARHRPHRLDLGARLQAAVASLQAGASHDPAQRAAWRDLPPGREHALAFQPASFAGTRPVALLDAGLDGDGLTLELVMARVGGEEPQRLRLRLENRPSDAPESLTQSVRAASEVDELPSLGASVPASLERIFPPPQDLPPIWYGVVGLVGGVLIGLLAGFLLA